MSVVLTSRRRFLQASAGIFTALPILRPGFASAADAPTRFVIFTLPNGVRQDDWFSGDINNLGPFLNVLAPFKDRMSVMRGLTNKAALMSSAPDHQPDYSALLTGRPPQKVSDSQWKPKSASIDQAIGAWTQMRSDAPAVGSLHFGARSNKNAFFSSTGSNVRAENNPYSMFDRHFASLGLDDSELQKIRARRQSVLDIVSGDLRRARCAYGAEEQQAIDAHLERVRSLEKQVQALGQSTCAPPTIAEGLNVGSDEQMIAIGNVQQQMLALSLSCGITRVATMQHASGQTPALSEGNSDDWHTVSHDNAKSGAQRQAVDHAQMKWPPKQFLHLLEALDGIQEGEGTVLDHTMVLWVHEQGKTPTHDRHDHCAIVAGGANGQLKGGQAIDFGGRKGTRDEGQPFNKLLVTAAKVMGMDINRFGDDMIPEGPLAQIMT